MPEVLGDNQRVIGYVRERAAKGLVHAVVVHESAAAWGKTLCGLWFTRDKKVRMMKQGGRLVSASKQKISCIECIVKSS